MKKPPVYLGPHSPFIRQVKVNKCNLRSSPKVPTFIASFNQNNKIEKKNLAQLLALILPENRPDDVVIFDDVINFPALFSFRYYRKLDRNCKTHSKLPKKEKDMINPSFDSYSMTFEGK